MRTNSLYRLLYLLGTSGFKKKRYNFLPPAFWQAHFWTFCMEQWKEESIHEGNVQAEALCAATAYVAHLRASGELPPVAN